MHYLKIRYIVSAFIGGALLCATFGAAHFAQASALSSTQIGAIINLLQAFGADSGTVSNVQAVLEGQTPAVPANVTGTMSTSTLPNGCTVLSDGLHIGSTDRGTNGEVSKLQQFLGQDNSIYPNAKVTGYFGTATEEAVQRWQENHNVVATGTPDTTGFGVVGPQTRTEMDKEMETECEQSDTHGSSSSDHSESASSTPSSTSSGDN